VNQGENFNAIIDLLKMVMYKFPAEGGKLENFIPAMKEMPTGFIMNW
jgi:elongation factor G